MEGVFELLSRGSCYSIASPRRPPEKYLGPILLTRHSCFWAGLPLSLFCPETPGKFVIRGEERNNHTNDVFVCNT